MTQSKSGKARASRAKVAQDKSGSAPIKVRLLFADGGSFHHEDIQVPNEALTRHERLIDCLREDPALLGGVHVNTDRLCAAYRVD